MTQNDIEMILYAYGLCSKSVDTIQNYKKFILNGETFNISDVIRNRKEDLDDKKD